MSYIITGAENDTGVIGYKNLFTTTGVTVTTTSDQTGFEKENGYDWKSHTWWKPTTTGTHNIMASFASAKSANYMGIAGHNLHEVGGSVKPIYSTDGGSTWNDAAAATAPVDGSTIFVTWTTIPAAKWAIELITTTGASIIAVASIGELIELERGVGVGFAPPTMAEDTDYYTSVSQGGQFLGRSVRAKTLSTSLNLTNLSPTWVRNTWQDFLVHARIKPFFWSWESENHSDEAVFCWVNKKIKPPTYNTPLKMSVSLSVECNL